MLKKTMLLALIALMSMLGLAACGDNTPAAATTSAAASCNTTSAAGDILIGLMGPFTGPGATFGTAIKNGAQMAVADVNKACGINGRQVKLIERDDVSKADLGVQGINDLISKEKVFALFGTANTAVGIVQAPIVNQSKIPWVIPVTTGTAITQDVTSTPSYIFRNSMVDSEQAPFAAEYAIKAGYKKIALMSDATAYGQGGHNDVKKALTAANITPVADETYNVPNTEDDMKPVISRIKATGADVIINWGLGAEAGNIRKAQADVNFTIPMIGSWGLALPSYVTLAGNNLANGTLIGETFLQDTPPNTRGADFVTRYKKEYNTDLLNFPSGLAQSYDAMHILLEAMKQPGADTDKSKLRDALENFGTYDGIIKTYTNPWKLSDAKKYHDALGRTDFVMAVWKDGKLVKNQ